MQNEVATEKKAAWKSYRDAFSATTDVLTYKTYGFGDIVYVRDVKITLSAEKNREENNE